MCACTHRYPLVYSMYLVDHSKMQGTGEHHRSSRLSSCCPGQVLLRLLFITHCRGLFTVSSLLGNLLLKSSSTYLSPDSSQSSTAGTPANIFVLRGNAEHKFQSVALPWVDSKEDTFCFSHRKQTPHIHMCTHTQAQKSRDAGHMSYVTGSTQKSIYRVESHGEAPDRADKACFPKHPSCQVSLSSDSRWCLTLWKSRSSTVTPFSQFLDLACLPIPFSGSFLPVRSCSPRTFLSAWI